MKALDEAPVDVDGPMMVRMAPTALAPSVLLAHGRAWRRIMDGHVLKQIRAIGSESLEAFAADLIQILAQAAGGALAAPEADDGFRALLRRAQEGVPQVVRSEGNATVVISMKDLAALLATAREPTLAQALKEEGFKPRRLGRSVIKQRRDRVVLRRNRQPT